MASMMDDLRKKLIKQAEERVASPARESTTPPTPEAAGAPTHTSMYTSSHTPASEPAPPVRMQRTQVYLRPDQIKWLDKKAKQTGKGVTRSDWVRHAVDQLMRRDVDA